MWDLRKEGSEGWTVESIEGKGVAARAQGVNKDHIHTHTHT